MKKFKEFEVKNLDQLVGGITIKLEFTNLFDGNRKNDDLRIETEAHTKMDTGL